MQPKASSPLFRTNIGAASCAAIRGGRSGCAKPISHRQARALRAREAAPPTESAPRPSPPLAWCASPPSGRARP
eukprot:scaffold16767_cov122-Isochrysis_galbana.AAC.3